MANLEPLVEEVSLPNDLTLNLTIPFLHDLQDDVDLYEPRTKETIMVAPPEPTNSEPTDSEPSDSEPEEPEEPEKALGQLLTPGETPAPDSPRGIPTLSESPTPEDTPKPDTPMPSRGTGSRAFQGMNTGNIILDRHARRSAHMASVMPANAFHTTFHTGLSKPLHRDHLPSEPKGYKDLKGHLFEKEFRVAI